MACRFPGRADTIGKFWSNILNRVDCIEPIPSHRWNSDVFRQLETNPETEFARVGGFVHDIEDFDSAFFGISPREAIDIDPQQRILLELAWRCMEDAAIAVERLKALTTGVYVGVINHDHERLILSNQTGISAHSGLGRSTSIASNRISYCFNFNGPSLTIDTACSSSLTAVDSACKALRLGEVDAAFAGGANAILLPESYIEFSRASMLSKVGKCQAFDRHADGFVRAEGGGLILLKRLSDALLDGDRIYATIVASTLNQDGRTAGIMAPNLNAQKKMMVDALQSAGLDSYDIGYVESHGTGTQVGDTIEAAALGEVYGQSTDRRSCPVGSVKTNIGHTEAAAGIAGLIKAVLAVWHGCIPPNLNYSTPNPSIDFDSLGIHIPTSVESWNNVPDSPRIAAVNSFGFGGANAHVIVQQSTEPKKTFRQTQKSALLLPLTAPSQVTLDQLYDRINQVKNDKADYYTRLCHTAGRRPHLNCRSVLTVDQASDNHSDHMIENPKDWANYTLHSGEQPSDIAFVFNGIGVGEYQAGQELYSKEPIFRSMIELCDTIFQHLFEISTVHDFFERKTVHATPNVVDAHVLHFALQVSICNQLKSWGLLPKAVIGHSVGEIAAACVSGCIDLVDAARIVAERAQILQQFSGKGLMLATGLSFDEAQCLIRSKSSDSYVAARNSSSSVTLSGTNSSIENLRKELEEQGRFVRTLDLPVPFHSPLIQSCESQLLTRIQSIEFTDPEIRWFSSVKGCEIRHATDSMFWWRNFCDPVQFAECMQLCIKEGVTTFVEIGPHPYLAHNISECLRDENVDGHCTFSLKRTGQDALTMRSAAAKLFRLGNNLNWEKINPVAEVCDFPATQLEHKKYRRLPAPYRVGDSVVSQENTSSTTDLSHPSMQEISLDVRNWNWLNQHRIDGKVIFPAAGYINLILETASNHTAKTAIELNHVQFMKFLELSESSDCDQSLYVSVSKRPPNGSFGCDILKPSQSNAQNIVHAHADFNATSCNRPRADLDALGKRFTTAFPADEIQKKLSQFGLDGDYAAWSFSLCRKFKDSEALIKLTNTKGSDTFSHMLDPTLLDMCFRTSAVLSDMKDLYVPKKISKFKYWGGMTDSVFCHVKLNAKSERNFDLDANIIDERGWMVASVSQLILQKVNFERKKISRKVERPIILEPSFSFHHDLSPEAPVFNEKVDEANLKLAKSNENHSILDKLVSRHNSVSPLLTELTIHYIGRALKKLGFPLEGERGALSRIEQTCQIDIDQRHLFHALLKMLEDNSLIHINRKCCTDANSLVGRSSEIKILRDLPSSPKVPLAELYRLRDASEYTAEIRLIDLCGSSLRNVLTGHQTGIDTLFPHGTAAPLQDLYRHSPTCRPYLEMLIDSVNHLLVNWQLARRCRILEIGGGTGAILSLLAPLIEEYPIEYTFTDISSSFVRQAKKRFQNLNALQCRTFDIDASHDAQGFSSNSYDLIIAADVMHLSHDIENSLNQFRDLLVPGGRLNFIELTKEPAWASLVFGMLRDWWHLNTDVLQSISPCHHAEFWNQQLDLAGFTAIQETGHPELPHTVFSAECTKENTYICPAHSADSLTSTMIFCAADTFSGQFIDALECRSNVIVRSGAQYSNQNRCFEIRNNQYEDYVLLSEELKNSSRMPQEVIMLWNFFQMESTAQFEMAFDSVCSTLLSISYLIKSFNHLGSGLPKFTLVSANAHQCNESVDITSCLNATLWSIGRTIRNEFPETACRLIDINPAYQNQISELSQFIQSRNDVLEAVLDDSGWRLPIAKNLGHDLPSRSGPIEIQCLEPGNLSSIKSISTVIPAIEDNEVLLEVTATALNFRDVMLALDMLPDQAVQSGIMQRSWGMECAGRIVKVGERVKDHTVGDRVVALAPGSMKTLVAVSTEFTWSIPNDWTFQQAVGLPAAYVTAVSCLTHLPTDRPDNSVLIHSASGGVGLALINLLKQIGATIYATASSTDRVRFLKNIGVNCVASSRTTGFATKILSLTEGKGVDMIINSLAGEQASANAQILKTGGVYVELGKHQSMQETHDSIRRSNPDARIQIVDIDKYWKNSPKQLSSVFHSTMERIKDGDYPVLPHTVFSARNADDAFRYMAEAKHIGKVVVEFGRRNTNTDFASVISPEATYLVAGGTRGFGFATVLWLSNIGARHIVVVGRNPNKSPKYLNLVKKFEISGMTLETITADLADMEQLQASLAEKMPKLPPIKGVFHCAMEIEDRMLTNLNINNCQTSMRTKILGAWNLHKVTEGLELDFFALYSSLTSLIGPSGQASYSASNAFLDSFAKYLRTKQIPAISVNWGAVSDYGYVADNQDKLIDSIDRFGITSLPAESMLMPLEGILGLRNCPQLVVSSGGWVQRFSDSFRLDNNFKDFDDSIEQNEKSKNSAYPPQHSDFEQIVLSCFSRVLEIPMSSIEPHESVLNLGVDSLLAVELSHLLRSEGNLDISATELLNPITIHDIVKQHASPDS